MTTVNAAVAGGASATQFSSSSLPARRSIWFDASTRESGAGGDVVGDFELHVAILDGGEQGFLMALTIQRFYGESRMELWARSFGGGS